MHNREHDRKDRGYWSLYIWSRCILQRIPMNNFLQEIHREFFFENIENLSNFSKKKSDLLEKYTREFLINLIWVHFTKNSHGNFFLTSMKKIQGNSPLNLIWVHFTLNSLGFFFYKEIPCKFFSEILQIFLIFQNKLKISLKPANLFFLNCNRADFQRKKRTFFSNSLTQSVTHSLAHSVTQSVSHSVTHH